MSGMSVGFTIGASTTKFVGSALNLNRPGDLAGSYAAGGAGGAMQPEPAAFSCRAPWCDPAARWSQGRRRSVGGRRRRHHQDAMT